MRAEVYLRYGFWGIHNAIDVFSKSLKFISYFVALFVKTVESIVLIVAKLIFKLGDACLLCLVAMAEFILNMWFYDTVFGRCFFGYLKQMVIIFKKSIEKNC